ncbi:MAG TPA: hypothetical protein VEF76_07030 [Patescibacteria group bacterium]|nr:hypothetical protein [Patescibacteria group bacterium]
MSRGLKLIVALLLLRRKGGRRVILLMLAVLAWAAVSGRYVCALPGRPAQLHCAVISNTGLAHMTRGMNMETIAALKNEVKPGDLPHLKNMLTGKDAIAAMTAAEVLKAMGEEGKAALTEAYRGAKAANDTSRAMLIQEHGDLSQNL